MKNEKVKNSQQLNNNNSFSSMQPNITLNSTSMLEENSSDQQISHNYPVQDGGKIASIGNDGFDNNNSLKPLNVPTSSFSSKNMEKSSKNPIDRKSVV